MCSLCCLTSLFALFFLDPPKSWFQTTSRQKHVSWVHVTFAKINYFPGEGGEGEGGGGIISSRPCTNVRSASRNYIVFLQMLVCYLPPSPKFATFPLVSQHPTTRVSCENYDWFLIRWMHDTRGQKKHIIFRTVERFFHPSVENVCCVTRGLRRGVGVSCENSNW